jgi:dCMP deaminase
MNRPSHDLYFSHIAAVVATRSACHRRHVGCVLTDSNNQILSTGYNGAARGVKNCESGCLRDLVESGTYLDSCYAIHAEVNALLQCAETRLIHTCYVTASPCISCLKMLMNTHCQRIVFINVYPHPLSQQLWESMGREWIHLRTDSQFTISLETMRQI